jgi:hypothetical protein
MHFDAQSEPQRCKVMQNATAKPRRLTLTLESADHTALKELAAREGCSLALVARRALKNVIAHGRLPPIPSTYRRDYGRK